MPKSSDQQAEICSPKYTWKSIASSEPARRWEGCCWHPSACPLSSITARWGTSQQPSRKQSSELSPGTNSHLQQIWQRHRHLRRDTGVAASPSPTIGSLAALPPVTPSPRNGTPSSPGSCLGRAGLGCASRRGDRQRWGTQRRSRAHPWLAPHGHTGRHGLSARTPPVSRTARERRRIVFHKLIKLAERKGSSTWLQATHPSTERALLFCRFCFLFFFFKAEFLHFGKCTFPLLSFANLLKILQNPRKGSERRRKDLKADGQGRNSWNESFKGQSRQRQPANAFLPCLWPADLLQRHAEGYNRAIYTCSWWVLLRISVGSSATRLAPPRPADPSQPLRRSSQALQSSGWL